MHNMYSIILDKDFRYIFKLCVLYGFYILCFVVDFQTWLHSDLPVFPSEEDLEAAALGLIRWQEKDKLHPENITEGEKLQ